MSNIKARTKQLERDAEKLKINWEGRVLENLDMMCDLMHNQYNIPVLGNDEEDTDAPTIEKSINRLRSSVNKRFSELEKLVNDKSGSLDKSLALINDQLQILVTSGIVVSGNDDTSKQRTNKNDVDDYIPTIDTGGMSVKGVVNTKQKKPLKNIKDRIKNLKNIGKEDAKEKR